MTYLLAGLDQEYDALVTSITTRSDDMSLNDVYAHLLSFELRLEQRNGVQIEDSSVNFIAKNNHGGYTNNVPKGRGRGKGRDNPPQRNNNQGGGGHYNKNGSSGGNCPVCQVCGKMGHIAMKCYHRFDHS